MSEEQPITSHKKNIGTAIAVAVIAFAALFAYWIYTDWYPSTDDAYVEAHIVQIAAQISGPVAKVMVHNHQQVKKGASIFTIDPRPFQLSVEKASAGLQLVNQQVMGAQDAVATAKANVNQAEAKQTLAQQTAKRVLPLVKSGQLPKSDADSATSHLKASEAALRAAKGEYQQAKQRLGKLGAANAQVRAAQATLSQAKLNLAYATITAPADGYIENFSLRPGTMIIAGNPLFAEVESGKWWISANFKETDLVRIKVGQKATIDIDMYPSKTFTGQVASLGRGSGATFSLLPPENATGNWVKVTQRFPVRITLDTPPANYPLRVGASSTVTINTR